MGYNFFNINKLTIAEINMLIKGYNFEQKEKKRSAERAKKKGRR